MSNWISILDSLPEKSNNADWYFQENSIRVLVKGKNLRPMIAFWSKEEYSNSIVWYTDCSETWNITDKVEYWTNIPE